MASVTITEDTDVIQGKITKEDNNNIDVLEVSLPNNFSVDIGDDITYKNSAGTTIFTGLVKNRTVGASKDIKVFDHSAQLLNRIVNKIYASTSPEGIISDIISNYSDLTYNSTISSGVTITKMVVKDKRAWDVIKEISELLNANTRTDISKNFYLEIRESTTSTKTITTDNDMNESNWVENGDQIVNYITLIGDKQIFDTDESFNGTGAQTVFTLTNIPIDVRAEHPVGTELTGYVQDASTGDYTVDRENKTITFDSAPASGTNNVKIFYTYAVQIKVTLQNNASITSYTQQDKKIEKPYLTSFSEARDFARNYLSIYKDPLKQSTWLIKDSTNWNSYVPNQQIDVTDDQLGNSGLYIIKKVEREYPGFTRVTVGEKTDDVLDWQKEVQYRIKQLEEKDDNSDIVQNYELVVDGVKVQVAVAITRYEARDKGTCFYLGDDDNGLLKETATPYTVTLCDEGSGEAWRDIS
jgi:hypothetical protein